MIVGVPVESFPDEHRVALVPASIAALVKAGVEVVVQEGAGQKSGFSNAAYEEQGARLEPDRAQLFAAANVLLQVRAPGANPKTGEGDLQQLRSGQAIVGFHDPLGAPEAARKLAEKEVTAFALELLPRITRAQPMDALTSMATVSGYKAVLLAAAALNKMCPLMMTAAGTLTPARVLIVGAGVAGLQAIATAHRLGAVVQAYDIRPAVKEQVESLGVKFLELELATEKAETGGGYAQAMDDEFYRLQRELMAEAVSESDMVITTAAVPGRKAPVLVTTEMIQRMQPGSVVLDLAAEGGGNCELTQPGETVMAHGVTISGPINVASTIPHHASQMYSRNITVFLQNLLTDGELNIDLEDEIIRDTLLTHNGEVTHPRVCELLGLQAAVAGKDERSQS